MQDGAKLLALRQPGRKWWRGGRGEGERREEGRVKEFGDQIHL